MNLTQDNLQIHLKNRFGKETSCTYFGLDDTTYVYKFDRLILKIGHYKDNTNNHSYKISFENVASCRITEESYIHEFKEEIYEGFSFLWQVKNSRFKREFGAYSLYQALHGADRFQNLKCYRVVAQNNFIDVLTTKEPIIELIEAE